MAAALPLCGQTALQPTTLHLAGGKQITLSLPPELTVSVAYQGLHRVRFFAKAPDGRIFVTDMHDRSDNSLGTVYILDGWDERSGTFARAIPYLQHLRNPNDIAFYTDPATHQSWLYLPLTDRLVRYAYRPGDLAPSTPPEVLAHYPDYGLNYKYGGWHLTRTIAFATLHGRTRLYVSVGSSCDACTEKEPVRASLSVMDPNGSNAHIIASGLRNAVGLKFVTSLDGGALLATDMGADHLGDHSPEDTFFELDSNDHPRADGTNYGWPTCYFDHGTPHADTLISAPKPTDHIFPPLPAGPHPDQFDCTKVPAAYTSFFAHSSPLGLEYFDSSNPILRDSFVVALHGAGHPSIGTGYRLVRFSAAARHPENLMLGFLTGGKVNGRPCDLFRIGPDSFLLTDDLLGVIYYIHPRP